MELTKRERALLMQARSNPNSREPMAKVILGLFLAMLAGVSVTAWFGAADRQDVFHAMLFAWVGVLMYQHAATQANAWSLIAKLDGSIVDRVPPGPLDKS